MAHVSRVYLCNVVNTLDNTYFRKAIDEVERQRAIKYADQPPVVEVSKDMLELLTSMTSLNLRGSTADKRYLGCLKFGAKKRQRSSSNLPRLLLQLPSLLYLKLTKIRLRRGSYYKFESRLLFFSFKPCVLCIFFFLIMIFLLDALNFNITFLSTLACIKP
jgi:hypothetical protein